MKQIPYHPILFSTSLSPLTTSLTFHISLTISLPSHSTLFLSLTLSFLLYLHIGLTAAGEPVIVTATDLITRLRQEVEAIARQRQEQQTVLGLLREAVDMFEPNLELLIALRLRGLTAGKWI